MRKNKKQYTGDRVLTLQNRNEEPVGLMDLVMTVLTDVKRNDVKKWLRYGHLTVNGRVAKAFDTPVSPDDEVRLNLTRPWPIFNNKHVKIVYEDDDVIVIDKAYGLLSVATNSKKKTENAYDIVRDYVKSADPRNKLWVVHRLDRHTTGLMMFAKSERANDVLRHNWNNIILERLYYAVVEGYLERESGYIKSYLTEDDRHNVFSTDVPGEGRIAVTNYEVEKKGNGYSLTRFSLDTGRKNQIRVHASEMGHPIAGDKKYGAQTDPIKRLALHAATLRFAHPITKKDMHFKSEVPFSFYKTVKRTHEHR